MIERERETGENRILLAYIRRQWGRHPPELSHRHIIHCTLSKLSTFVVIVSINPLNAVHRIFSLDNVSTVYNTVISYKILHCNMRTHIHAHPKTHARARTHVHRARKLFEDIPFLLLHIFFLLTLCNLLFQLI